MYSLIKCLYVLVLPECTVYRDRWASSIIFFFSPLYHTHICLWWVNCPSSMRWKSSPFPSLSCYLILQHSRSSTWAAFILSNSFGWSTKLTTSASLPLLRLLASVSQKIHDQLRLRNPQSCQITCQLLAQGVHNHISLAWVMVDLGHSP